MRAPLLIGVAVLLGACAPSPHFERTPRRWIDRPLTLPKQAGLLELPVGMKVQPETLPDDRVQPLVPVALFFGASDRMTVRGPAPEVRYALLRGGRHALAADAGVQEFAFQDESLVVLSSRIRVLHRYRLSDGWVLDSGLGGGLLTKGDLVRGQSAFLPIEVGAQVTDELALRFGATPTVERGSTFDDPRPSDDVELAMPLGVEALWSLHCRWDAALRYTLDAVGREAGARHLAILLAAVRW